MIAYFALLSFVPLLSFARAPRPDRTRGRVVVLREGDQAHPSRHSRSTQIIDLVRTVQDNATALGVFGGIFLLWTSLSLFSVLESAFNIVYGRPNRSFLHGKGLAILLMLGSLVTLFVALLAGSLGVAAVKEYAPGVVANSATAYTVSIAVSTARRLPVPRLLLLLPDERGPDRAGGNPGRVLAAILLEATFQVLPLYQRYADLNPGLRAFGAPAILLVWLYVMSNVIVLGAELNWWRTRRREQELVELPGLA